MLYLYCSAKGEKMPPIELNAALSYLSLSKLIRSDQPKEELEDELISLLCGHLKRLGIKWNPSAFRAGLNNPELPEEVLRKLEDFLNIAESLRWSLPFSFVEELDKAIEDIESFNPAFCKFLKESKASGRVSVSAIKKRLGI
jgi:hypothetical protein